MARNTRSSSAAAKPTVSRNASMTVEEAAVLVGAAVDEIDLVEAHDAGTLIRTGGVDMVATADGLRLITRIANYSGSMPYLDEPDADVDDDDEGQGDDGAVD